MKTFIISFTFLLLSAGVMAQHSPSVKLLPLNENSNILNITLPDSGIYHTKGTIWVQDSIYYYIGNPYDDEEWDIYSRFNVVSRDSLGKPTSKLYYIYHAETGEWNKVDTTVITYFENQKMHTSFDSPWNSNTLSFNDTIRFLKYDEEGNLLFQVQKDWNTVTNTFTSGIKWVYKQVPDSSYYNIYTYQLNINTNVWEIITNEIHYYTSSKTDTLVIRQGWNNSTGEWDNVFKYRYTFENGSRVSTLLMLWYNDIQAWVNSSIDLYSYNDQGNMLIDTAKVWNAETEIWENSWKAEYYYNDLDQLDSIVSVKWIGEPDQWQNYSKETTFYENDGQQVRNLMQFWDTDNQTWLNTFLTTYLYNENDINTEYSFKIWNKETGNWRNNGKYCFYWSLFEINGLPENIASKLSVYPNPATNIINVIYPELNNNNSNILNIYSLSGQLVKSTPFNHAHQTVNISSLPPGIYFVSTIVNNRAVTIKFLKQ